MRKLENVEMEVLKGGEALTLTMVIAVMSAALIAVICYRLFVSKAGSTTLPGGYRFEWK